MDISDDGRISLGMMEGKWATETLIHWTKHFRAAAALPTAAVLQHFNFGVTGRLVPTVLYKSTHAESVVLTSSRLLFHNFVAQRLNELLLSLSIHTWCVQQSRRTTS
ncbi:hypothetical protein EVAR_92747_1 [Eumeta japonica]|uniref:Uncharacterized protein n=1 Tax=Eumeta variegata TaxID=151549 RepID=A0A4C1T010_EUMVA|nr:hypothetical protein EVAR_92747_1 [Eumeta japonica]